MQVCRAAAVDDIAEQTEQQLVQPAPAAEPQQQQQQHNEVHQQLSFSHR
jgi:hypothetical protein